jgi:hypothetical protein
MVLTSFKIIGVEILQKPVIKAIPKSVATKLDWDCTPEYQIGLNDNDDTILKVAIGITRMNDDKQYSFISRTSFELVFATKDTTPSTEDDFFKYAFFTMIALDHARVQLQYELKDTPFAEDLLPQDTIERLMEKTKLALSLRDSNN